MITAGSINTFAAVFKTDVSGASEIIFNMETGQILSKDNEDKRLGIASLTKLIPVYMTEQAIAQGKLKRDQVIHVSKELADWSQDSIISNVPMSTDQEYTIQDLINAAMLPSSNAATIKLVELVSGDIPNFYKQADKLLESWGIEKSNLVSPTGVSNGDLGIYGNDDLPEDAENKFSAKEMAIIAYHVINDYPDILKVAGNYKLPFPDANGGTRELTNLNEMMLTDEFETLGLKSGTPPNNTRNLINVALIDGQKIVTVIMNSPGAPGSNGIFIDTTQMLRDLEAKTSRTTIGTNNKVAFSSAKTPRGQVTVVPDKKLDVFYPKGEDKPKLLTKVKALSDKTEAPFKKNQIVAKQDIKFDDAELNDFLFDRNIEYKTNKKIDKENFFVRWVRSW